MGIDLGAIKARAEAATKGPWEDFTPHSDAERFSASVGMASLMDDIALNVLSNRDAEFIAAARTDIPALIAEVERLRGIVDRVREVHAPIDALNTRYNQVQKVCTGCGTDDGNWQNWPCPTIRALEDQ